MAAVANDQEMSKLKAAREVHDDVPINNGAYVGIVQGTAQWRGLRVCCITGSGIASVMKKQAPGGVRKILGLDTANLGGIWQVAWGQQQEPLAVAAWCAKQRAGTTVQSGGYYQHPQLPYVTMSPDAIAETPEHERFLVEVKSVAPKNGAAGRPTPLKPLAQCPPKYRDQLQHGMWVLGVTKSVLIQWNGTVYETWEEPMDAAWQATATTKCHAFYDRRLKPYWERKWDAMSALLVVLRAKE